MSSAFPMLVGPLGKKCSTCPGFGFDGRRSPYGAGLLEAIVDEKLIITK